MADTLRIPTETEITDAFDIVDQSFEERGGPWVVAKQPEVVSKNRLVEREKIVSLACFTVGAELILDGPLLEDPVPARRAMRYGMQAGLEVVDVLYARAIKSGPLTFGLEELIRLNRDKSDEDRIHDSITTVRCLGDAGLALIDLQPHVVLDRWAEAAVNESYLQHLYSLGCGTMLFTAQAIQKARVELQAQKTPDEIDLEEIWEMPAFGETTP